MHKLSSGSSESILVLAVYILASIWLISSRISSLQIRSLKFGKEYCQVAKAVSFSVIVKIIPVEFQAYERSCSCVIRSKSQPSKLSNDFICSEPASAYGFKALEDFFPWMFFPPWII